MDDRGSPSGNPAGAGEIDSERNKEWHPRAAELAEDSANKYEAAADARKAVRLNMLGYLQLNEKAKEMYLAAQEHKDEAAKMEQ